MKATANLYNIAGENPIASKEITAHDIGEITINEVIQQLGVKPEEVYANDTLEINFNDFK